MSKVSGRAGELLVDTSSVGFQFDETASAQDALLVVGNEGGGVLSSSATNTFSGVLSDINVTIVNSGTDPVDVTVRESHDGVLFGSSATLRIESGVSRVLTDRFRLSGSVQTLSQLRVS